MRERLIGAAIDLLLSGGEAAVTTVSVTGAVGVVQSAFYRHFSNVEECLAAAAERVTSQIREAVDGARRQMYEIGPGMGEDLVRFYRDMFGLVAQHRPVARLLLRYRSDPQALNGVVYRFARGLSADLAEQLANVAARAGWSAVPKGGVEALADNVMGASLAAVEAYLERRGPAIDASARLLAAFTTGAFFAVFEALGVTPSGESLGSPSHKVARRSQ
jgi:AcrR family transcriptional regulator